jgi:hypothetical protein
MVETGSTLEKAMERLMNSVGSGNYTFSSGNHLKFKEETPGLWKTNVIATDWFGTRRRASVNRLVSRKGKVYYRAWFGLT